MINTKRPSLSWNLYLAPTKKNSGVEPEEELEMREGIGLMRGAASLSRVWQRNRDRSGSTRLPGLRDQTPIISQRISPLTGGAGGIMEVDKNGLSRNPMFNDKVAKVGSHLLQSD